MLKKISIITFFLFFLLGFGLSGFQAIAKEGHKIHDLQTQKAVKQQKIKQIKRIKQQIQAKKRFIISHIVENQQQLDTSEDVLARKKIELGSTQHNLVQLQDDLAQSLALYKQKKELVSKRIRRFYMEERVGMLQLILDAKNLSGLLDRIYYKQRIYDQDKAMMASYLETVQVIQKRRKALMNEKVHLDTVVKTIQRNQVLIQKSIELDKAYKSKLDEDLEAYESSQRQLENESRAIESDIMSLVRRSTGGTNLPVRSTGIFGRPSSGPVRSGFGYRRHPIFGRVKMHTGVDFGGAYGSPILAADGGRVIFAGWRGGYGKVVIINHGERNGVNITTLYGHMSSIGVSNGQSVAKGQVVGRVGSTGYSTGPHLHFEVRQNGSPVDPMRYLR